jgi:hypothetical protein
MAWTAIQKKRNYIVRVNVCVNVCVWGGALRMDAFSLSRRVMQHCTKQKPIDKTAGLPAQQQPTTTFKYCFLQDSWHAYLRCHKAAYAISALAVLAAR